MTSETKAYFKRMIINTIRLYFAPLTGAVKGACNAFQSESQRIKEEERIFRDKKHA